jgi:hypothetical protein
VLTEQFD